MKCLSLWQPWATLLVSGAKRVETRSWPIQHRGPLLIHAAKKWSAELYDLCRTEPFRGALIDLGHSLAIPTSRGKICQPRGLPFGAIIGRVDVVECYHTENVDFDYSGLDVTPNDPVWGYASQKLRLWHEEKVFGDYTPGRYAFLCSNPVRFSEPIPCRGMQGLFEVPDSDVLETSHA